MQPSGLQQPQQVQVPAALQQAIIALKWIDPSSVSWQTALSLLRGSDVVPVRFFCANWVYVQCKGSNRAPPATVTMPILEELFVVLKEERELSVFDRVSMAVAWLVLRDPQRVGPMLMRLPAERALRAMTEVANEGQEAAIPLAGGALNLLRGNVDVRLATAWLPYFRPCPSELLSALVQIVVKNPAMYQQVITCLAEARSEVCPEALVPLLMQPPPLNAPQQMMESYCIFLASSLRKWEGPPALWKIVMNLCPANSVLCSAFSSEKAPLKILGPDVINVLLRSSWREAVPPLLKSRGAMPDLFGACAMQALHDTNLDTRKNVLRIALELPRVESLHDFYAAVLAQVCTERFPLPTSDGFDALCMELYGKYSARVGFANPSWVFACAKRSVKCRPYLRDFCKANRGALDARAMFHLYQSLSRSAGPVAAALCACDGVPTQTLLQVLWSVDMDVLAECCASMSRVALLPCVETLCGAMFSSGRGSVDAQCAVYESILVTLDSDFPPQIPLAAQLSKLYSIRKSASPLYCFGLLIQALNSQPQMWFQQYAGLMVSLAPSVDIRADTDVATSLLGLALQPLFYQAESTLQHTSSLQCAVQLAIRCAIVTHDPDLARAIHQYLGLFLQSHADVCWSGVRSWFVATFGETLQNALMTALAETTHEQIRERWVSLMQELQDTTANQRQNHYGNQKSRICYFHLNTTGCKFGAACKDQHVDLPKDYCKFFQNSECVRPKCPFKHEKAAF